MYHNPKQNRTYEFMPDQKEPEIKTVDTCRECTHKISHYIDHHWCEHWRCDVGLFNVCQFYKAR